MKTTLLHASQLEPGDVILCANGDYLRITERYTDPDGTWIKTDDGDEGYVPRTAQCRVILP